VSARQQENIELLDPESVYTVEPKDILVIGHTDQLRATTPNSARHRRESFESFRRNLINPEVITYDELLSRARLIVALETGTAGGSASAETATADELATDDFPLDLDEMPF
jgi:Domain of unknown function (DUF4263)